MAEIDKIHGKAAQYDELVTFLKANRLRSFIDNLYDRPPIDGNEYPIANFTCKQDGLLITKYRHETPAFVIDRILDQYSYSRKNND